ncbi:unnamed protein product [Linum trigynum]|uniref:Uncharacterized protein n=1 Tax=Linum trigynum TaxID=586398 RepID=A0AAV2CDN6_9ROSI
MQGTGWPVEGSKTNLCDGLASEKGIVGLSLGRETQENGPRHGGKWADYGFGGGPKKDEPNLCQGDDAKLHKKGFGLQLGCLVESLLYGVGLNEKGDAFVGLDGGFSRKHGPLAIEEATKQSDRLSPRKINSSPEF